MLKKLITLDDGKEVIVRELTVKQVRDLFMKPPVDLVDSLMLGECSLTELEDISDLSKEDMESMAPSDLQAVLDAAKEVNPGFFGLKERLEKLDQARA